MILTDFQIRSEIEMGRLKISPFKEDLINPSSLDVRLGNQFGVVKPATINIDPSDPLSFHTDMEERTSFILKPGGFVLSMLLERVELPDDISSSLRGKSSLARLGLDNSSFGAWIDPGFSGSLVIELANHSHSPIILTHGMKIGQLIFYKHVRVETPYGQKKTSRYMHQSGVQGSKGV